MLCITVEQLLFLLEAFDKLFAQIISRGIYDYRKFVTAYAVNIVIAENSLDYRACVRDQHISEFVTVFVVVHLEIVYFVLCITFYLNVKVASRYLFGNFGKMLNRLYYDARKLEGK